MHILITDSGVGGLSVVAYAERFVRTHGCSEPVQLTFANAAPENDYGYNSMATREEKLTTFDRFLRNVTERFAPDSIYVACNTLSVLLPEITTTVPARGIVETGVSLVADAFRKDPQGVAIIFGTQTTIDAGAYPRLLNTPRVISQACPGLADVISEDREGTRSQAEIRRWVRTAIGKMENRDAPVVAALACTHYGYRQEQFVTAFAAEGVKATVINPNERAVDDLFHGEGLHHDVEVAFVTRYAIPDATVEALTFFLDTISPRTVAAMQHFVHIPDLF